MAAAAPAIGFYGERAQLGGAGMTPPWAAGGRGAYFGQPIVILGGSSSVGQYGKSGFTDENFYTCSCHIAIQFAKLSGFSPIITTVSPDNNTLVTRLGATHIFDRSLRPAEISAAITTVTSLPIATIFDAISIPETQQLAYNLLAMGGTLILTQDDEVKKSEQKEVDVVRMWGNVYVPVNMKFGREFYAHLGELLATGDIKVSSSRRIHSQCN